MMAVTGRKTEMTFREVSMNGMQDMDPAVR